MTDPTQFMQQEPSGRIWLEAVASFEEDFLGNVRALIQQRGPFVDSAEALKFAVRYGLFGGVALGVKHPAWAQRFQGIAERLETGGPTVAEMEISVAEFVEAHRL